METGSACFIAANSGGHAPLSSWWSKNVDAVSKSFLHSAMFWVIFIFKLTASFKNSLFKLSV